MYKINLFYSDLISGFNEKLLTYITVLSVLAGILIIVNKNPIVSVLFLIVLFLCIAIYLMSLGLNFLALAYLLVYVGAVSILFLFILMLINIRISELYTESGNSIPLGIIAIIIFYNIIVSVTPFSFKKDRQFSDYLDYFVEFFYNDKGDNNKVYNVSSNLWDGNIAENTHISALGNILYTNYFIWLIISSFILLLAMIGAIIITLKLK